MLLRMLPLLVFLSLVPRSSTYYGHVHWGLVTQAVRFPDYSRSDDIRRIRDGYHELPFDVAMRHHHFHVMRWLHPHTPLHNIAEMSNPGIRLLGPASLVQIVGPVSRDVCGGCLFTPAEMLGTSVQSVCSERARLVLFLSSSNPGPGV